MPKAVIALLTALVATAAVVLGLVLSRDEDEPKDEPAAAYTSTPLSAYETAGVALVRDSFCDAVPAEAAVEALGGEPESVVAYDNGERARISDQLRDVAHEFGCTWPAGGATARAWVFAPPVTPRSARELAREIRAEPGCEPIADAPDFGKPSAALVCELGQRTEVSYRGLFGDAWLTCTLSAAPGVPLPDLIDRAGRWCVAVVEAARA
jgi:hypothetical protein